MILNTLPSDWPDGCAVPVAMAARQTPIVTVKRVGYAYAKKNYCVSGDR